MLDRVETGTVGAGLARWAGHFFAEAFASHAELACMPVAGGPGQTHEVIDDGARCNTDPSLFNDDSARLLRPRREPPMPRAPPSAP